MGRRKTTSTAQLKFVFEAVNPFGDTVTLERANWEDHLIKHREMIGRETDIQATVENPELIRESLSTNRALVYEKTASTDSKLVRAVVYHRDPSKALTGGTTCSIATAYIRDEKRYPSPNVGKIVWPPEKVGGKK